VAVAVVVAVVVVAKVVVMEVVGSIDGVDLLRFGCCCTSTESLIFLDRLVLSNCAIEAVVTS